MNVWAVEWGSKKTNWRGQSLLEAFAVLDLKLLNDGELPTFIQGECTSMIDLTFTSSFLARGNCNWEVSDIITLSDHRAITWNTAGQLRQVQVSAQRKKLTGWRANTFDAEAFRVCMENSCAEGSTAEEKVAHVMREVGKACDTAMHRRRKGNRHLPVYWWSEDINKLRAESLRARRKAQRARGKPCFLQLEVVFKEIRRSLRKAIGDSKKRCWIELIEEMNNDPWGRPYKVVMSKLNGCQQPTCPDQLERIVQVLFPMQEPFEYRVEHEEKEMIPPITHKELMQACRRLGNTKHQEWITFPILR
uniref:Endonuclease/exonuclease/phosphatase domain-containing protein n=1 Tax=Bracon brevicornis TaxID=1563983 RepID=A0A6V7L754_9HYME